MQFGCCINVSPFVAHEDKQNASYAAVARSLAFLADAGYDFVEFAVGSAMKPTADEFDALVTTVAASPIPVRTFNGFIPPRLPVVGPQRDVQALREYLAVACQRVANLGGTLIVFGSGGARKVPDNYSMVKAQAELLEFLQLAGQACQEHGLTLVIEPLNQEETNMIHTVDEAIAWAQRTQQPNVSALADTYHMDKAGESVASLIPLAGSLKHVHVADTGRLAPGCGSFDYKHLSACLTAGGYQGHIVVECHWGDFKAEVVQALTVLKQAWE